MKLFITGIFVLSTTAAMAQSISVDQLASLLSTKRTSLEAVNPGMSKKVTVTGTFVPQTGTICDYIQTSVQSVLKVEGDKIIVLSQEEFTPGRSLGCQGVESTSQKVLYFENKPSLAEDLEELRNSDVKSIVLNQQANTVQMVVNGKVTTEEGSEQTEEVKITYDLNKSSFKNVVLTETKDLKAITTDMADIDVNSVDLTKVVFCPASDSAEEECMEGDFSDILF